MSSNAMNSMEIQKEQAKIAPQHMIAWFNTMLIAEFNYGRASFSVGPNYFPSDLYRYSIISAFQLKGWNVQCKLTDRGYDFTFTTKCEL